MASRSEYKELLNLKNQLETALDIDDYEAVMDIYSRFTNLYKKVTGKNFESNVSAENLKKIRKIINRGNTTKEVSHKDLIY